MSERERISVSMWPDDLKRLEELSAHYQGPPTAKPVSQAETVRRAVSAEWERAQRAKRRGVAL